MAGAGCIGKTTISYQFNNLLKNKCQIVSLDAYMLERKIAGELTGYNPRRFELQKAKNDLNDLICFNKKLTIYQYNRKTHKRDIKEYIEPKEIILIEGGLALRKEFLHFSDIRIFLDADENTQFKLRLKREQEEFNSNVHEVKNRFYKYFKDYKAFIFPQIKFANIIFSTDLNYNLTLTKSIR